MARWSLRKAAQPALVVVVLAYSGYACLSDSGPYRWLAELQTRWFGGHEIIVTFMIIAGVGVAAVTLATSFLEERLGTHDARGSAPGRQWSEARKLAVAGAAFLVAGAVSGAIAYRIATQVVSFESVDLAKRQTPRTKYVELSGTEQRPLSVTVEQSSVGSPTVLRYVPVTGPDWLNGEPLTYFVEETGPEATPTPRPFGAPPPPVLTRATRSGVLVEDGLPSVARVGFEKKGVKLASDVFVLEREPKTEVIPYAIGAAFCLMMGIGLLSTAIVFHRRRQRLMPT